MKELSRFEMAAVKRTAQNVKNMRRKKEKLEEKQTIITAEINQLTEMIDTWEQPIIRLTGGFTSEQILNGEMNTEISTQEEVQVISDATLDDSPNTYIPTYSPKLETIDEDLESDDNESPFKD